MIQAFKLNLNYGVWGIACVSNSPVDHLRGPGIYIQIIPLLKETEYETKKYQLVFDRKDQYFRSEIRGRELMDTSASFFKIK